MKYETSALERTEIIKSVIEDYKIRYQQEPPQRDDGEILIREYEQTHGFGSSRFGVFELKVPVTRTDGIPIIIEVTYQGIIPLNSKQKSPSCIYFHPIKAIKAPIKNTK